MTGQALRAGAAVETTRALLLTDVVDSTRLSEALGDAAMAEVWARHDRVARDLLVAHGGREIDKTDGMLLMFDAAAQALRYAAAYHAGIGALEVPLRARAGLHVGPVILRENSPEDVARGAKPLEVDGLAKPIAARIMAVAQGGQTLFSTEARAALEADVEVLSHGHWLMKGVTEPIELFELPGADTQPPVDGDKATRMVRQGERWLPVRQIPNNLPPQSSRFIGREQELRDIKALLGSARLVTLLGMGGLGKTRLSLQAAAELMHQFPDGVWFLDLAPISEPELALSEVAQVLGVRSEPERSLLQTVCAFLKDRRVLLIFDNCEHLVAASAKLAHAVLQAAPQVRLAASSREALNIPGERTYPITPLPVPQPGDDVPALLRCTAVRLFVDRIQAHKPGFELTAADAPAVAELVARLEGIPLALELAAARIRALSVADINRRLSDRYKLLTGGARTLQARQQTLRALVDWSWDMLNLDEQTLLMRLAVFRGGFELEAVEAVCGEPPLERDLVMDLLVALVEKSLVMREEREDRTRYRMLETIREYAHEKLRDAAEDKPLGAAHALHFFNFAKQGREGLKGPQQGEWLDRLETDQDNLRAVMALALSGQGVVEPVLAVKMAVALQNFWILRGHASEGRSAVRAMLAQQAVRDLDVAQAHALYVGATLAWSQSDHEAALTDLQTCLDLRRALGQPADIAATLATIAMASLGAGHVAEARSAAVEALAMFREVDHPLGEVSVLLQLGQIEAFEGHAGPADDYLQQAARLARRVEHPESEAEAAQWLGQLAFAAADAQGAAAHLAHALQISLAANDRRSAATALWWLARVDLQAGRFDEALQRLGGAVADFHSFGMREQLLGALEDVALAALQRGDAAVAAALAQSADGLRRHARLPRSLLALQRWQQLAQDLEPASPPAQLWDTDEAVRQALRFAGFNRV